MKNLKEEFDNKEIELNKLQLENENMKIQLTNSSKENNTNIEKLIENNESMKK